jgi:hypothetical protein
MRFGAAYSCAFQHCPRQFSALWQPWGRRRLLKVSAAAALFGRPIGSLLGPLKSPG